VCVCVCVCVCVVCVCVSVKIYIKGLNAEECLRPLAQLTLSLSLILVLFFSQHTQVWCGGMSSAARAADSEFWEPCSAARGRTCARSRRLALLLARNASAQVYTYMSTYMYQHLYLHLSILCLYIYLCLHLYVCIQIYVYTYLYT
jgi:hypothetical protein